MHKIIENCEHCGGTGKAINYACEKCGTPGRATAICPEHGEYCSSCHNGKESKFPIEVCPDCNITFKSVFENAKRTGRCVEFNLQLPLVLIRNDSTGYWFGSEKKKK